MPGPKRRRRTDPRAHQRAIRQLRVLGLSLSPLAAPLAAAAFNPVLGIIVPMIELIVVLALIGIVVYGHQEQVDRIFRLLRWFRDRAEPPRPDN